MPALTSEQQELKNAFFENSLLMLQAVVVLPSMLIKAEMDRSMLPEVAEVFDAEIDKAGCITSKAFQEKYNNRFLRRIGANKQTAELAGLMIKSSQVFEEMLTQDPDLLYAFVANPKEFLEKNPEIVIEILNMQSVPELSKASLASSKLLISDLVTEPLVTYEKIKAGPESFIEARKDIQEEFKENFNTIAAKYTRKASEVLTFMEDSKLNETLGIDNLEVKKIFALDKNLNEYTQDDFEKGLVSLEQDVIPKFIENVSTRMKDELDGKFPKEAPSLTDKVLKAANLVLKHTHEDALERKDSTLSRDHMQEFLSREPCFAGKMLARKVSAKITKFLSSQTHPLIDYVKTKEEQVKKNPDLAKQHQGLEKVVSKIELSDIPKIVKAMGGAKKVVSLMMEARKFCKEARDDVHINKDAESLSAANIAFNAIMKVVLEREAHIGKQYNTHAVDEAIDLIEKKTQEIKERKQGKAVISTAKKDVRSLVVRFRKKFLSLSETVTASKRDLTTTAVSLQSCSSKAMGR